MLDNELLKFALFWTENESHPCFHTQMSGPDACFVGVGKSGGRVEVPCQTAVRNTFERFELGSPSCRRAIRLGESSHVSRVGLGVNTRIGSEAEVNPQSDVESA
jgi:hypothetical protein